MQNTGQHPPESVQVLGGGTLRISELVHQLRSMMGRRGVVLVGVDGCGGSGKSTFARGLVAAGSDDVTLVQMDDFYKPTAERPTGENRPIGGNFDWERVRSQVIEPLSQGEVARYQRYDWGQDALAEWHVARRSGIVVIEGVYATRNELRSFYDYRVFVECPRDERLRRGLERDGEAARDTWEKVWMPVEAQYMDLHQPWRHADLLIDGSRSTSPHGRKTSMDPK